MPDRALHQPAADREPDFQMIRLNDNGRVSSNRAGRADGFSGQQHLRIGVLGAGKNLGRGAGFNDDAVFHHADPVGDLAHDGQVMGDEQHRQPCVAL